MGEMGESGGESTMWLDALKKPMFECDLDPNKGDKIDLLAYYVW